MASTSIVQPTLSSYQTALAILLPPSSPFYQDINTLRALYDKNHKIWPPHINLLYPFVAPEHLTSTVENIQRNLSNRLKGASIDLKIKLDKAGIWKHKDHATVYLSDSGTRDDQRNLGLAELRQELLELFESPGTETRSYTPHLTIGQTGLDEEVMMGLLSKGEKLVGNAGSDGIGWDAYRLVVLQRSAVKSGMKIVSEIVLNHKQRPLEEEGDTDGTSGLYHVYAYSSAARSYLPYTPSKKQSPNIQEVTLATYNIFTESAIPTDPAISRYPRLLSAILSTTASVLNLQEVTDDFLAYILSQPEIRQKFPYSTHSSSHGVLPSWRNCVSLSQYPIGDENGMWEFVDLGKRHKGAVVFELPLANTAPGDEKEEGNESGAKKGKKLIIANVHLTCGISDGSTAAKVTQLRVLSAYFRTRPVSKNFSESWAICGDLNIPTSQLTIQAAYNSNEITLETFDLLSHGGEDAKGIIPEIWQDTYDQTHSMNEIADIAEVHFDYGKVDGILAHDSALSWQSGSFSGGELDLGPGELGATFNPFTNQLAAEGVKWGANPRPQRYDRILTSRNVSGVERTWMEIKNTGRFGLEGGSDHWGLYAEFRIRELGTITSQGTNISQKKILKLESRVHAQPEMSDASLEKYLAENDMLPSRKDYSIREEAKEVLTMVLKESKQKRTLQTPVSGKKTITPMRHVHDANDPNTQYHDADDISTVHFLPEIQRLGVTTKPQVKMVVQPVGSYYLNLFTPNSDIDVLCASNISARVFWVLVKQRIRRHNKTLSKIGRVPGTIRIVRTVEAQSGTMMELEYIGGSSETEIVPAGEGQDGHKLKSRCKYHRVRMDLQYCQVPEKVLDSWNQLPYLPTSDPIFSLSASTLKKLNAYRDSCYLLQTIPNLKLFRLTYRLLKLWAIRRGIFSARFGYLGGVHLVLLLSSLFKRISQDQIMELTAGEVLRLFFGDYAGFNYQEDTISDPDFAHHSEYRRTSSREPIAISTIHSPMVNVAHTASKHTLKTLRDEILLANQKLNRNCGWDALTGRADGEAEKEFLSAFGNFVKIDLRYWGRNIARGRSLIGWIESRCVMLLVELNAKVPNMHARMWPGRFVNTNEASADEELNGFYLIGLLNTTPISRTSPPQRSPEAQEINEQKRQAYNKFMDILRSFEGYLREEEKKYEVTESYIAVTPVSRQAIGDGVRIDTHLWWDEDEDVSTVEGSNYNQNPNTHTGEEEDEDSLDDEDSDYDSEDLQEEEDFSRGGARPRAGARGGGALDHNDDHVLGVLNAEINTENSSILQVQVLTNTSGTSTKRNNRPPRIGRSQLKREQQQREHLIDLTSTNPDPNPPSREYIKKTKLRPAHDIINRIKWDSEMDIHDYIVGYEDRFLGTLQMGLEKWMGNRKDETEEDWVPMHRVVWIRRASDGVVVWDRERRVDIIFGSGDMVDVVDLVGERV